jgi:excisionase family DNA binding protein
MANSKRLYTCKDVAERYGVQIETVWKWVRTGKIPFMRIGKLIRFYESDLKAYEERRCK